MVTGRGQGRALSKHIRAESLKGDDADQKLISALNLKKDRTELIQKWFLESPEIKAVYYHSKWPNPWAQWGIDWFRNDHLNVLLSVRAFAQGLDLRGAVHVIIRTSTSNVRLRIQTIGRMIRKKEAGNEAEIWIIYVKDTTDERIFEKHDWEDELQILKMCKRLGN